MSNHQAVGLGEPANIACFERGQFADAEIRLASVEDWSALTALVDPYSGSAAWVDRKVSLDRRYWLLIGCLGIAGCAAAPKGRKDLIDFLDDGVTRREEVLAKLGPPSARFEDLRILAYRLASDDGGYLLAASSGSWADTEFNLMLIFDRDGLLQRHALVRIHAP